MPERQARQERISRADAGLVEFVDHLHVVKDKLNGKDDADNVTSAMWMAWEQRQKPKHYLQVPVHTHKRYSFPLQKGGRLRTCCCFPITSRQCCKRSARKSGRRNSGRREGDGLHVKRCMNDELEHVRSVRNNSVCPLAGVDDVFVQRSVLGSG